jgi:ketosteroid isomerase-like protein
LLAEQLKKLFSDYQQAFKVQDIAAVLDCYQLPCTLVTPDRLVLLATIAEAEQEFAQIFSGINELAIQTFTATKASFGNINDNIIAVNIHWQFFAENETVIADFSALYHIVKNEQQFKIFQVISHENEPSITLPWPLELS